MMQQVIINADDFGRSIERNRAIDDSFRQGLIQSAGLIVTGKDLGEALDYIRKGGYYKKIHLHFNLSTSMRDGDSEDTPLTDAMKMDPMFCKNGRFKPYKGLPGRFSQVNKWRIVYRELVAQYQLFKEITDGKADYSHVDFHLWYNLTWPVSVALNLFTRRYNIKSVRYIGEHHTRKYHLYRIISWNPRVKSIHATNFDYYLSKQLYSKHYNVFELYCHPNYKEGVFLDDSPSYLRHERQPMLKQIQELRQVEGIDAVSWDTIV